MSRLMKRLGAALLAGAVVGCGGVVLRANAQTPPANAAPPSAPPTTPLPPMAEPRTASAPLRPHLLAADPPRDVVVGWLARFVPAARGRQVYINGDEAFWIEHQDVDAHNDLKITATLHTENFGDTALPYRSSYQVTQFDCEGQQQYRLYLTRYAGNGLTGDVDKDSPLIKRSQFVGPTTLDFAHLRAVCLTSYDHIRKRPYTTDVPAKPTQ